MPDINGWWMFVAGLTGYGVGFWVGWVQRNRLITFDNDLFTRVVMEALRRGDRQRTR